MRVAYMGNLDSPNARAWIIEMQRRGVQGIGISERQPSWDLDWIPLIVRRPRIRGLGIARRDIAHQIADACERHEVDVLHVHEANRIAIWARSSKFVPQVITCWGSDVLRIAERPLGHRFGVRRALKCAAAVTAGSEHLASAAVAAGARRAHVHVVGWGVETSRFRPDAFERERVRERWGLKGREVVLSTRLHESLYRLDVLVSAFSAAHTINPRLALVLAGTGSETQRLREQCAALGIASEVIFPGMLSSQTDISIQAAYAASDIFCSIPQTDGGPLSVLEAMASEMAVIAADLPAMREWIQPGVNGYLWSSGIDALVGLLLRASPSDVGSAARAFVCQNHERATEMDRIARLYEEVASVAR